MTSESSAGALDGRDDRSLDRAIVGLAVPALGALVAEPLFLLADTAMVGHLGTSALAGLSLAAAVLQTAVGLMVFLAYATTPTVARLRGSGDLRGAVSAGIDGLWLAAALGVALAAVGWWVTPRCPARSARTPPWRTRHPPTCGSRWRDCPPCCWCTPPPGCCAACTTPAPPSSSRRRVSRSTPRSTVP